MRDPSDPWADEQAMATPDPPPKSDPPDYAAAARRGMAEIRATMGWDNAPQSDQTPIPGTAYPNDLESRPTVP